MEKMMMDRRGFIGGAAALAAVPGFAAPPPPPRPDGIRAVLLHWGRNMWGEALPKTVKRVPDIRFCNEKLRFNEAAWRKVVNRAVKRSLNMVVIDLGEFPAWPSHPELAVEGSYSPDWIRAEVRRLRKAGLEPIPKLNFSTAHDAWLKDYGRMVSTSQYYRVCADVIRDAAEMFDHPRFLHIGYDEETVSHQTGYQIVRQGEMWWHDFLFFVRTVEEAGMRPWMWSDYGWSHPDFVERCPKSVLQSNWYYDEWSDGFDLSAIPEKSMSRNILELFLKLDKAGFEQVPCASNWSSHGRKAAKLKNDECMERLVRFCNANISPAGLKGYMAAPWAGDPFDDLYLKKNFDGIDQLDDALATDGETVIADGMEEIVCGATGSRHLQGIASDRRAIYWSFTDSLVKTDLSGHVLAKVDVPSHSGDLCVHDGKVYVATDEGRYARKSGFKQEIRIYDAATLAYEGAKNLDAEFAADDLRAAGVEFFDGRFWVAAGQSGESTDENNYVMEYSPGFKFVKRHAIESGSVKFGLQTIAAHRGKFYMGMYGNGRLRGGAFISGRNFSGHAYERIPAAPEGVMSLGGVLYAADSKKDGEGRWRAVARPVYAGWKVK